MIKKILIILFIVIIISLASLVQSEDKVELKGDYFNSYSDNQDLNQNLLKPSLTISTYSFNRRSFSLKSNRLILPHINYSKNIRGIYINGWSAGSEKKISRLLNEMEKSHLNAVVIDLKDVTGRITFTKGLSPVSSQLVIKNLKKLVDRCHKRGIYVIGRLAVFKDPVLAKSKSDYALKYVLSKDKEKIINSENWTSPYSKEVWKYNVEVAKKAAELGLDEIQFDYIRFPTLAKNSKLVIMERKNHSKSDTIVAFLKYAKEKLEDYQVLISADVFGLTTTVIGDLGIGQDISRMVKYVDYISPMIYPSHYSSGMYGIDNPDSNPYYIIASSLEDAKEKLGRHSYKLRPWLQDFSLHHRYEEDEVKAQIEAVEDKELSSWLLWNPQSTYTINAVMEEINREEVVRNGSYRRESYPQADES